MALNDLESIRILLPDYIKEKVSARCMSLNTCFFPFIRMWLVANNRKPTHNVLSNSNSLEGGREDPRLVCSAGSEASSMLASLSGRQPLFWWLGQLQALHLYPTLAPANIQRKRCILFQGLPKERKSFFFPRSLQEISLSCFISTNQLTWPFLSNPDGQE